MCNINSNIKNNKDDMRCNKSNTKDVNVGEKVKISISVMQVRK